MAKVTFFKLEKILNGIKKEFQNPEKVILPQLVKILNILSNAHADKALAGTGVYKITNIHKCREYVGYTAKQSFGERMRMHLSALGRRNHHCRILQIDWNEPESYWMFEFLESCSPEVAKERENFWIDKLNPFYNTKRSKKGEGKIDFELS